MRVKIYLYSIDIINSSLALIEFLCFSSINLQLLHLLYSTTNTYEIFSYFCNKHEDSEIND